MNNNHFLTEEIIHEEIDLKGEKKYIIKGFISTTDPDSQNEIITDEGQDDLMRQLSERTITFDDDSHDSWIDPNTNQQLHSPRNTLPVAKVIKAERIRGEKNGVFVEAEMNTSHPKFPILWESIKKGFLHAFSVAFYPVEAVTRTIKGVTHRLINKLNLVNITPTGYPINPAATFVPVMKAQLKMYSEEKKMEDKPENNFAVELKALTEKFEAEKVESEKVVVELKAQIEASKKESESLRTELETLKAKIKEPVLKSEVNVEDPVKKEEELVMKNPLSLIR